MSRPYRRLPKGYDRANRPTSYSLGDLLPLAMSAIEKRYSDKPQLLLALWPRVVGPKIAPMTQALSFVDGVLTVKVSNSTLYSLLNTDKQRLLRELKRRCPEAPLTRLHLRLG